MAMQTNMNIGIRPIERPQTPTGTEGISRRGDGGASSGFSPRTEVAIQTAVEDMAGILSKISSHQDDTIERMPEELQKIVQNILKQSFAMNETLSKGIGSALESQRFSMEQLTALSRMLHQLGNLVEKGFSTDFGDDLSALLKNLKNFMIETEGSSLEPALLNKASFELLDTKTLEELPDALKAILTMPMPTNATTQTQNGEGSSLLFLKQLVNYFMPKPENAGGNFTQNKGQFQNANQNPNGQTGNNIGGNNSANNPNASMANNNPQSSNNANTTSNNPQSQNNADTSSNNAQSQNNANTPNNNAQSQNNPNTSSNNAQSQNNPNTSSNNAQSQNNPNTSNNNAQSQNNANTSNNTNNSNANAQNNSAANNANVSNNNQMSNNANTTNNNANPQAANNSNNFANANANNNAGGQGNNFAPSQNATENSGNANNANQNLNNTNSNASNNNSSGQQQFDNSRSSQGNAANNAQGQSFGNANANSNTNNTQSNNLFNAGNNTDNSTPKDAPTLKENLQNRYIKPNANGAPAPPTEAQQARVQLSRVPFQNTPQAMETLKNTAEFLLKNNEKMTEADIKLLQNFINGRESVMTGREARQLQTLLRLCQQNVPTTLQQAAVQQNLPELPRLWAFMTLCDFAIAKRMTGRQLKRAGKDVADLVLSMRHSMTGTNREVQGQRSLNFMMPLYMENEEKSYPSYIHVYDENEQDPYTGEIQKETWLRLCVLTDNIGAVELTCRIYGEGELDMRLFFSDHEIAEEFRDVIPNFIGTLGETRDLTLNEIKVGAVDERRFL